MKHERKFREHEGYEGYASKKDKKHKGHRGDKGIGELWADMCDGDDLVGVPEQTREHPTPQNPKPAGPAFQFNEDATIDVKGYKIDLSRVKDVVKTQTVYNNKDSFGISFLFVGNKGLGRTIYYGTNFHQRDEEFEKYYAHWLKVKK